MPRCNKRTRHCLAAIKKRWNDKSKLDMMASDAECDQPSSDAIWMEGENEPVGDDQFVEELRGVKPNVFEELLKKRQPDPWKMKGRKRFYTSSAELTLRNKRASWKKAALDSSKITDWFLAINTSNSGQDEADDNYELPFDEAVDS